VNGARARLAASLSTPRTKPFTARSIHMLDIILVAAAVAFFALSVGYTIACDRL
jgi:hypothetical protein